MAAVEGGLVDPLGLGGLGQLLADGAGRLDVAAVGRGLRLAAGRRQRHAVEVVDELGINVLGAAEDAQPRPFRRADDALADVLTAAQLLLTFGLVVVHGSSTLPAAGKRLAFLA